MLRAQEAVNEAMRIAIEKDDDELEIELDEESPASTEDGTLISPAPRPKISQRPTRMMPAFDDTTFHNYILGALAKAKTEKQKDDLRVVLERGLKSNLISQEAVDELLLMLVKP